MARDETERFGPPPPATLSCIVEAGYFEVLSQRRISGRGAAKLRIQLVLVEKYYSTEIPGWLEKCSERLNSASARPARSHSGRHGLRGGMKFSSGKKLVIPVRRHRESANPGINIPQFISRNICYPPSTPLSELIILCLNCSPRMLRRAASARLKSPALSLTSSLSLSLLPIPFSSVPVRSFSHHCSASLSN